MEALVLCRSAAWHAELQDFSRGISDASEALEIYRSLGSPQETLGSSQNDFNLSLNAKQKK